MNVVLGIALLVLAAVGARRLVPAAVAGALPHALACATLFVAIFLGAFLVQGFVEIATDRPVVRLSSATVFAAVVLLIAIATRPGRGAARRSVGSWWRDAKAGWRPGPVIAALGVASVFVLAGALLLGGVMHGYEVKAYHLPLAIRVLRDGTLRIWDGSYMHAYPVNMSVWAGFFLVLLPERIVALVNLPFLFLLCTTVFALSRAVGSDRSAALLVSAGVATIPIIGFSALELGADVAGVSFIAIAIYLVVVRAPVTTSHAVVAGVAGGLAYGFKSLHLVPLAALALLLLVECGVHCARRRGAGAASRLRAFAPVFGFGAAALAMMSFWLVRNYVQAGNPLYPVHLGRVFDLLSWKAAPDFDLRSRTGNEAEWVDASWKWLIYPWVEGNALGLNFKHSSGVGAFFAATLPVVLLLWPVVLFGQWRRHRARPPDARVRAQAVVFGVGLVVVLAWCLLGDRQPRYVMTAIVMTAPLTAWTITQVEGRLRTSYEGLLAFCVLFMGVILVAQTFASDGVMVLQGARAERNQRMEYPPVIDRLPQGAVIGNGADREMNFLLLGDGLRNNVIDILDVKRRFGTSDGQLRFTSGAVKASGITHLYVTSDRVVVADDCVRLREIDRIDRNPLNGHRYESAHVIYRIDVVCEGPPR